MCKWEGLKGAISMNWVGGRRVRTRGMALGGFGGTRGHDDGLNAGVRSKEKLRDKDQSLTRATGLRGMEHSSFLKKSV